MPKRAQRRVSTRLAEKKKTTTKVPVVPPKGPPSNLRPGGPHKDKRIEFLEREAEREMRSDEDE